MSASLRRAAAFFLLAAVVATLGCLLVYAVVQQDLRQGADDPQHQLAEDAVASLAAGDAASAVVGPAKVDIAHSLEPFLIVYDASGAVLASGGQIDGLAPVVPTGVRASAIATGSDHVTWQPRPGVRIATVVLPWSGGTVLAGRSLRRVEEITASLGALVGAGWLVLLVAIAGVSLVSARLWPRRTD